jgi:hypothetical protein
VSVGVLLSDCTCCVTEPDDRTGVFTGDWLTLEDGGDELEDGRYELEALERCMNVEECKL